MSWLLKTKVKSCSERTVNHLKGFGKEAVLDRVESLGWYVHFEGSWEAVFLGFDKPDLDAGDEVEIVIRKQ